MEDIIKRVVQKSGLGVSLKIKERMKDESAGSYTPYGHVVEIGLKNIEEFTKELQEKADVRLNAYEVAEIVVSHELGHAEDELVGRRLTEANEYDTRIRRCIKDQRKQMIKYYMKSLSKVIITSEEIAWLNTPKHVISPIKKHEFKKVQQYCLNTYQMGYWKVYKRYLVAFQVAQKIQKASHIFPADLQISFDVHKSEESSYDSYNNILHVRLKPLLKRKKEKKEQPISVVNYVYQQLIEDFFTPLSEEKKREKEYIAMN